MHRQRSRLAALVAALALPTAVFVGCGGSGGDAPAPAPATPPPAPTPSPAPVGFGPPLAGLAVVSRIDVPAVTPQPSSAVPVPVFNNRYTPVGRRVAWGDFNGDGLNDIVICPGFFTSLPLLPCEIWLNRGGGRFSPGTAEVVDGALGLQSNVNSLHVADFNRDGRADIVVVTQGREAYDGGPNAFKSRNLVFMSQPDGKLKDVSATALASDTEGFHHPSAVGDIDGDGWLDLAVTELGGLNGSNMATGVYFLLNDRQGGFVRSTAGLPPDVRSTDFTVPGAPDIDHLAPGTAQLGDLDGDGRLDLVTTAYINGSIKTNTRETRVYRQLPDGSFELRAQIPLPAELAALRAPDGTGVGAFCIAAGDLDGDGRPDIVIGFENLFIDASYVQVLRNDGSFAFSDRTAAWLGGYRQSVAQGAPANQTTLIANLRIADLNGDGKADLVLGVPNIFHNTLGTWSPFWLNDGSGRMAPWLPLIGGVRRTSTVQNAAEWTSVFQITSTRNTDLLGFDATGDGRTDWVFLDAIDANVTVNGMNTESGMYVRVLPQLP